MNFTITTPCPDCPFTRDCLRGWLGEKRMRQIMESLSDDHQLFPCHLTTRRAKENWSACAGALIFQERHNSRAVTTRIAMAFKSFDPRQLRGRGRVFRTALAAIKHHAFASEYYRLTAKTKR